MRKLIAAPLLVLVLLALAPLPVAAQVAKVTPMSHDFGDMKQQQTVTTKVTITNEGGGRLEIRDVNADCGCTVPSLTKHSLAPGESTDITIQFNSKRFNGKIVKAVHISTNDPTNSLIDVTITANVHTPLVISPANQRVGFSPSLRGETVTKQVIFTATGDTPLEISADQTRKDLFDIKITNNLDGNPQMAALDIIVPADMKPGQQRDNVRVATNVPDMATVDIQMKAWVKQALNASPDHINYRFKRDLHQTIRVAPFQEGIKFKIVRAECDLPEIEIKIFETDPNVENKIELTGKPLPASDPRVIESGGRMSGTLILHTNLESTPVIEIPITYMVRM